MIKEIRKPLIPMTIVLSLLLGLGIWQLDFVVTAITANIFLNSTIFGTFAFGVFIGYRNIFSLDNEVLAFQALREDQEDAENHEKLAENDPYWKYYRCEEKAIVFSKPKIIEQPFNIISEEIARSGSIHLSTGVMQNILDTIDDRINEKKSLIQYVTGILVFLGLIGTFVGLMVTLGSVGDIIGGIDLSGEGGGAAIQGLMNDLQIPLRGMATGFSSSLFGLITSLALGLMSRFSNESSGIFRANFEAWLAGLAEVNARVAGANGEGTDERQLSLMLRVAKLAMISNTKLVSSVQDMREATEQLIESQKHIAQSTKIVAESTNGFLESHNRSSRLLEQVAATLEEREELRNMMGELRFETAQQTNTFSQLRANLAQAMSQQIAFQEASEVRTKQFILKEELGFIVDSMDEKIAGGFNKLDTKVGEIDGVLSELEKQFGSERQGTDTKLSELITRSNHIQAELNNSIVLSKAAIAQADELEQQSNSDQGTVTGGQAGSDGPAIDLQKRLYKNFGQTSGKIALKTEEAKPSAFKKIFSRKA